MPLSLSAQSAQTKNADTIGLDTKDSDHIRSGVDGFTGTQVLFVYSSGKRNRERKRLALPVNHLTAPQNASTAST